MSEDYDLDQGMSPETLAEFIGDLRAYAYQQQATLDIGMTFSPEGLKVRASLFIAGVAQPGLLQAFISNWQAQNGV